MKKEREFYVGRVVGFRGLSGEIKVRPSTNNPGLLTEIESVIIRKPGQPDVPAHLNGLSLEKRLLHIFLEGFEDRTSVAWTEGSDIYTTTEQLRALAEDEFWVSDLIGLEVFTTGGKRIGTVCSIIDTAGQILEIAVPDQKGKTILVPFVKELVPAIDLKTGTVHVADIPGLLEPQ